MPFYLRHPLPPSIGTVAILLAGGEGRGLHELTEADCKPALPLLATSTGLVRLVDFTLSNAWGSGITQMLVATQHQPEALHNHLVQTWSPVFSGGMMIRNGGELHGDAGYGGTVDAVAANATAIDGAAPRDVLILAAHQVYQMDYGPMIAAHRRNRAAVTVAVHRVPLSRAQSMDVIETGPTGAVTACHHRPSSPRPAYGHPDQALVDVGVYVFDWTYLRNLLPRTRSDLDFGDLLLRAVRARQANAYLLPPAPGHSQAFWRDVADLDDLREAVLVLGRGDAGCAVPVLPRPRISADARPATKLPCAMGRGRNGVDRGQTPAAWTVLDDSVVLPAGAVGPGATLTRTIVGPNVVIPPGTIIGADPELDTRWFRRTAGGTTLVTAPMLARRAVGIAGAESRFFDRGNEFPSR